MRTIQRLAATKSLFWGPFWHTTNVSSPNYIPALSSTYPLSTAKDMPIFHMVVVAEEQGCHLLITCSRSAIGSLIHPGFSHTLVTDSAPIHRKCAVLPTPHWMVPAQRTPSNFTSTANKRKSIRLHLIIGRTAYKQSPILVLAIHLKSKAVASFLKLGLPAIHTGPLLPRPLLTITNSHLDCIVLRCCTNTLPLYSQGTSNPGSRTIINQLFASHRLFNWQHHRCSFSESKLAPTIKFPAPIPKAKRNRPPAAIVCRLLHPATVFLTFLSEHRAHCCASGSSQNTPLVSPVPPTVYL